MSILADKTGIYQAQSHPLPEPKCNQDGQQHFITVVFTTTDATLAALKHARDLVRGLSEEIRILIPQVVPYALPLNRPPVNPAFRVRPFRMAAAQDAIDTRVEVLLCRDRRMAVSQALQPHSLVLIGHQRRWWCPERENSFARALRRAGHQVVTVSGDGATRSVWHVKADRIRMYAAGLKSRLNVQASRFR